MSDRSDDRAKILARRRFFVASAIAGIAVACDGPSPPPRPCLNVRPAETPVMPEAAAPETTETPPRVCLDVPPPEREPAVDAGGTPPEPTHPQVCLKVRPNVCLDVAPPSSGTKKT